MHQDGSTSGRARAARIRASHEYEGTELESMRRRPGALPGRERPRSSLMARVTAALARTRPRASDTAQIAPPEHDGEIALGLDLNE